MGTVGGAVVGRGLSLPSGLSVRTRDRRGCPRSPGCRGSPRSVRRGAACALSQRSLERRRSPAGVRAPSASLRRADLGPRFVAGAAAASRHLLCPSLSRASAWTVAEPAGPQLAGCACRLHGPAWIGESTAPHAGPACHTRSRSAVCLSAGLSTPAKTPRPRSAACPSWPRPHQRSPHRGPPVWPSRGRAPVPPLTPRRRTAAGAICSERERRASGLRGQRCASCCGETRARCQSRGPQARTRPLRLLTFLRGRRRVARARGASPLFRGTSE